MKFINIEQPKLLLFLTAFFFYCLLSPGNLPGDTEIRWSVSRQFIRTSEFTIENHIITPYFATGIDGKRYSFWGPGQQFILLPFAYLGFLLEKKAGISEKIADLVAQFFASVFLFPFLGAVTVVLFFQCALLLGYTTKTSLVSALTFGFATMHVHYTVFTHEQSQVALLILLQLFYMLNILKTHRSAYVLGFCVSMGMCLFFRISSLVETLSMLVVASYASVIGVDIKLKWVMVKAWFGSFVIACCPFIVVLSWYNILRFGKIFETGYGIAAKTMFGGIGAFEANPFYSLLGILFSPGKSLFVYNPILIFSFFGFFPFYRKHKHIAIAIIATIAGNLIFNSFHTTWAGDYAWSCRYQVSILPLLILPITSVFCNIHKLYQKIFLKIVIFTSIIIQLASVIYSFHLEFVQNPNHGLIPDKYIWQLNQSHLVKRFENIFAHAIGKREIRAVDVVHKAPHLMQVPRTADQINKAYIVNFFPFKAYAMHLSDKVFYVLVVLWVMFLILFFVCVINLHVFLTNWKSAKLLHDINCN